MRTHRRPLTALDACGILAFYALGAFCIGAYVVYYLQLLPQPDPDNETAHFMNFLLSNTLGLYGLYAFGFAIWMHLEWRFDWREKRKA